MEKKIKAEYIRSLCEVFQNEIKTRKSIQEEGGKPPGLQSLVVNHATLNVRDNSKLHFTNNYEQCTSAPQRLIIRRGFPFSIFMHCDRHYDPNMDIIIVELSFGTNPTFQQGTKKLLRAEQTDEKSDKLNWRFNARIQDVSGCDIELIINTTTNCPVGEWKLKIQTGIGTNSDINAYTSYVCPDFIFILFNPWCQDDTVYLADDKERKEYVLNDSGTLWQGAKRNQFAPCPWNFGQFEDASLYAAMLILRMSDISDVERKDPVLTARKLTEAINDYVVEGRWSEPFDDGTKPWEWTGSVEIMEKFMCDPTNMVKYGQCWVFSGVLVTLCRTLGIPCRSVTNINSAHDTDRTLTIDDIYIKHPYSKNFKKQSNDSVWNFHVWNEAWMQRLDLPPGYDGWQVCDATPQEQSQGRYQCGPMSLEAIRQGKVQLDYDGWFIYGEVNADVVSWYYISDLTAPNGMKLLKVETDTKQVGTCIVTTDYDNPKKTFELTSKYKPAEGTDEEREQFRSAVRAVVAKERTEILKLYDCDKKAVNDVSFDMNDIDIVPYGKKVSSLLNITNESRSTRTVMVTMEMYVVRYDGVKQAKVTDYEEQLTIDENNIAKIKLDCHVNYYGPKLKENNHMCVEAMVHVLETGQIFSNRDSFLIQKASLDISGSRRAKLNSPTNIAILFNNPCNYPLTNCHIKVAGTGLGRIFTAEVAKQVRSREELRIIYTVVPRKTGKKSLVAVFTSDQLTNIRGTFSFEVD